MNFRKAAIYSSVSKYGTLAAQLGISMILARVIAPEDHGVISLITVILAFFNLFADFGLGITIVQRTDMNNKSYNELFSFSFVVGIVLVGAMCIMAYPISIIYTNKEYISLCSTASIVAFLSAINTVPNALLSKDKRFDVIAIRTIVCTVVSGIIAILLAYHDFGAYALIAQSLCSTFLLFVWNYAGHPLRLVKIDWKNLWHLLGRYSFFQILFNFLNYFTRNLDNLIIGAKFGEAALGHYNKAYTLNLQPNAVFTSVITGVLHPFVRDYKNDYKNMLVKLNSILKILSILGVFIMPICFWGAEEIIYIMFGEGWENAAVCFKMLSICIWAQMLGSVAGTIFLGIERTDYSFLCGVINFVLILMAIIVGIMKNNLFILSFAIGLVYNLIFIITYYILIVKALKDSFGTFLKKYIFDALFAFGFMGITLFMNDFQTNIFVSLLIKFIIYSGAYIVYLIITKQFLFLNEMIKMFIHRR